VGSAGSAAANLGGAGLKVALVASRFNEDFCNRLLAGAAAELAKLGVKAPDIETVRVPGALEIPMALQWLAQTSRFHALIALGVVIRGETYHFDLVANESSRGVMEVQLETGVPIANAIITTENEAQAEARIGKGAEAARVAVEMALLRARVARPEK
jgi:6,7-dimethyl-8-ribityllumazine synthase